MAIQAAGCAKRPVRELVPPSAAASLDPESAYLKIHLRDGGLYVLTDWHYRAAAHNITGVGTHYDADRTVTGNGRFTVALSQVALLETNVLETSNTYIPLTIFAIGSAALTTACVTHPKACFGSCPTFYVEGSTRPVAEGFSASIAPSLEATDIDTLWMAAPEGREVSVRMTNEAYETHVVKAVHLLAAKRPPNGHIAVDEHGRMWEAFSLSPPTACVAGAASCTPKVATLDGTEQWRHTDPDDLAATETIELSFARIPQKDAGLIVAMRQTFVTTYLFYQVLAYLGTEATSYLAALDSDTSGDLRRRLDGFREALGGVEVWALADGKWQRAGDIHETGPIATDIHLIRLPAHTERVRLTMSQGYFRIDYVATARLGKKVEPIRLAGGTDRTITALPGDETRFSFALPGDAGDYDLFLETRGYYLEWMRQSWIKEENPLLSALVLAFPKRALKLLAPAFKNLEGDIERMFWESRYVAH